MDQVQLFALHEVLVERRIRRAVAEALGVSSIAVRKNVEQAGQFHVVLS